MKTILLIEDDPSIQDAMQLIFQEPEYQLLICCSAEEALFENKVVPDIYLIDKQLSGFDGLELCRIFKTNEKTKAIPVVLLSASPNIHKLALEAGANDTVEKPFKIELLQETIVRLIS